MGRVGGDASFRYAPESMQARRRQDRSTASARTLPMPIGCRQAILPGCYGGRRCGWVEFTEKD
jgi:hypothetical protein